MNMDNISVFNDWLSSEWVIEGTIPESQSYWESNVLENITKYTLPSWFSKIYITSSSILIMGTEKNSIEKTITTSQRFK